MQIEIGPRIFEVTSSATQLPGEDERLHVVTMQPVARAVLGNQGAESATQTLRAINAVSSKRQEVPP